MSLSKRKIAWVLLSVVLIAALVSGCSNSAPTSSSGGGAGESKVKEIKIGIYGGFTGPSAFWNTRLRQGAEMAFEEINAKGGINGVKIATIAEDTHGNKTEAASAVQKLITKDDVLALLGSANSGDLFVAGPIADKAGVPIIGVTTGAGGIPQIGKYVFRHAGLLNQGIPVLIEYAVKEKQIKSAAIIHSLNNDYAKDMKKFAEESFKKFNVSVTTTQTFADGDTDFSAQASVIKEKNPDAVVIASYGAEGGLIIAQLRKIGYKGIFLGSEGWAEEPFFKLGGQAIEGALSFLSWVPDDSNTANKEFSAKFKQKFNAEAEFSAAFGYDTAYIVAEALKKSGPDKAKLRDALEETKGHQGLFGTVSFDKSTREFNHAHYVVKVANGNWAPVTQK